MALNHPALVAITPQTPHQNSNSFIKNISTRSSFCGTPTSNNKSFITNRKSWNGNGTLPLQASNCHIDISPIDNPAPVLATFKSGTGTFPRKSSANQRETDAYHREPNQRNFTNFAFQRNDNTPSAFGAENGNRTECRNNFANGENEILTPNGNTGVATGSRGNEMRRGSGHARRYAEIGNWSARSSTFLEPHIQGVGWRTAPDSDRGQEDHSTEDDEQLLIKEDKPSHQIKKPFIFPREIHQNTSESDREHKSRAEQLRERFELKQASRKDEVDGIRSQESTRNQEVESVNRMAKELLESSMKDEGRGREGSLNTRNESSGEFRPIPAADFRDSLSQSRESLSSRNSGGAGGGSDADGDCECDSSGSCTPASGSGSGSAERAPCDIGLLERLLRTHPVWFLPGIQRAGAFHLLQGKEEGNFVVRQSSQTDTMALSVRLPAQAGPYIEHYLIHAAGGRIGLETSQNKFDNIPDLVAHYSQCCDELPVQLNLPRALREAKNRQQLSSLALLGQEFWRYPMANPKPNGHTADPVGQGKGTAGGNQLSAPTPMSQTPSDTSSSFSSFSNSAGNQRTPHAAPEMGDANIVLNLTPVDNPCGSQAGVCTMTTFKGNSSPPNLAISRVMGTAHTDGSAFIRAPRPTPPNTLNLISSTAHITHQPSPTFPQTPLLSSQGSKNLPPPPPPRWAKPPFNNNNHPSTEIQSFSPMGINKSQISAGANITVTTTVTFSVHNQQNIPQPLEELLSPNNDSVKSDGSTNNNNNGFDDGHNSVHSSHVCQTTSKRLSPEGECVSVMSSSLQSSLRRRQNQEPTSGLVSPTAQMTPFSPEPIINNFTSKGGVFSPTNQVASPNGSISITSGIFSPSQINSPLSNATISSKSGMFSPSQVTSPALNKSELFSPLSRSSPISGKSSVFSPVSNQNSFTNNSAFNSPLMGKDCDRIISPNTNTVSTTTSGRSRKSKHSHRKESRHYQESDILESPGVYYRSSLGDKVSDYEDIWGPEHGGPQGGHATNRSTFRPNRDAMGSGMLISKRPDLLPDTLPKVTSLNSNILSPSSPATTDNDSDKEHHQFMALKMAAQQKLAHQCSHGSTEQVNLIIATTNSKGEAVPKRPDKLNLLKNANEQMTTETNERLKQKELNVVSRTDDEIERENHKKNISNDECLLLTSDFSNSADEDLQPDKQNSPFYADPVDAIKEAVAPLVQRRRVVRGMPGIGPSQRYSEPPTHGHPYLPLRDMHSIEELSPSSPNTSTSVDNLSALKSGRPRGKAVQPPRIKPVPVKQDQTWTVDSSWEFISKQSDITPIQDSGCREAGFHGSTNLVGGAFPSLAEQLSRLDSSAHPGGDTLTIHQVLAQRFPELNLSPYPTLLKSTGEVELSHEPPEDSKGYRMSSYDNVEARLAVSSQASDDGTEFSEPWDCSHWDSFLPPHPSDEPLSLQTSQPYDAEDDDSSTARERSVTPPAEEAPIRLATISRAKSFRDRLDPLLAPPRLLALRGSRGRPSDPGAPGEAVRAYALHLAADKTTTFAQNVDNFISCTKDSKETCPHVVMRNMRQFMSGMKNYLVKHGEREFEKEIEKERLKLKANEFLNLDAILEGVLNGAVVTPLRKHVYGLLADKFAKRGDVALLTQGLRMAKALSPLRLGIRPSVRVPSDPEMVVISQFFVKMQEADSPLDKLENLLSAISAIFNAMKSGGSSTGGPLGADDFLPVLVLTLARCNVAGAELEAELMAGLLPPPLLSGEGGYYLTTLFGAVAVLKKLASSDDPNKTLDWRTGSLGSGMMTSTSVGCGSGGVARVLMPDECSGALRCVALPWRPGARARDLCRQLAHRARITNPQDYALFALRDGEETLINDTDYPQDMVENNKSNCMLAYKRIDAKIAWPKQALQSFP